MERIVSGFVGERKDLCVEVRNNETGEVKYTRGQEKVELVQLVFIH